MPDNIYLSPRNIPVMIYDGDCYFCRSWIDRWRRWTGPQIEYVPSHEAKDRFREIPDGHFQRSLQYIDCSGEVFEGAEAVFRSLSVVPRLRWLLRGYQTVPGVGFLSEAVYRLVAGNRPFFSGMTRWVENATVQPKDFVLTRTLFLKGLALIYAVAFASLWVQIRGLIGVEGILPAGNFMQAVYQKYGLSGLWLVPTLCWFNSSDLFLQILCGAGTVLAVWTLIGSTRVVRFMLLWTLYLSLVSVGRDFTSFQWDILLLETGFLAIFLAPFQRRPDQAMQAPSSPAIVWLGRWLLFRLMFSSGLVKLTSGDSVWSGLTALSYHYETQPLPTWVGWFAHQLPAFIHRFSIIGMFGIELVIPFLILGPRPLRRLAFWPLVLFQLLIMATGNYCFFNLLTLLLCLFLLDDSVWPVRWREEVNLLKGPRQSQTFRRWPPWVIAPLTVGILCLSVVPMQHAFRKPVSQKSKIAQVTRWLTPFNLVNPYGLFAVMTTSRPEIIIEGSRDGQNWKTYEFRFKPGNMKRRPRFNIPHQPRLDWQMWFAALGPYSQSRWFISFCRRLLEGSPAVLGLLSKNPFPDHPPKYIRTTLYRYHFTDWSSWRKTKHWWRRERQGPFAPILALQGDSLVAVE